MPQPTSSFCAATLMKVLATDATLLAFPRAASPGQSVPEPNLALVTTTFEPRFYFFSMQPELSPHVARISVPTNRTVTLPINSLPSTLSCSCMYHIAEQAPKQKLPKHPRSRAEDRPLLPSPYHHVEPMHANYVALSTPT